VRLRLALVVLALAAAGCATVSPLSPLSGGAARQAWQELESAAQAGGTLDSWASVRVTTPEGRRSFRATIRLGDDGTVRMGAFTPVGTEVFTFEVRDGAMVFADHSSRRSWRGPFSEVAGQLGIPEDLEASDFARLLFGFPAGESEAELDAAADGIVRRAGMTYQVTGLGLAGASRDGTGWRVTWDPATYPPRTVTFDDGAGRSIVVRHLDISHSRRAIERLSVNSSYSCCFRPVIAAE
jgi:hypothetical protein